MGSELKRKSIHFSGLILPLVYLWLDRTFLLLLVGGITCVALLVELGKWKSPRFRELFFRVFSPLLRTHERQGAITGATYYLISALLCIHFFDKALAIVCIFFMVLGDMSAALVGKRWGKTKLIGEKSLEGSLACFVVCTAISIVFFYLPETHLWKLPPLADARRFHPLLGIGGAFIATVVELLPLRIDDNLTVPLIAGAVMQVVSSVGV